MIIEKIDVKSFGALCDLTMDFSDTVNVIEGSNESGKSTIAAFIKYMLFGLENGSCEQGLTERQKYISWNTGRAEGSMIIRVKGKRYHVARSTVPVTAEDGKVTYKEDCSITDLETSANSFGKMSAGYVFLGGTGELYENTAYIGQIGDSAINGGSVSESIENILFSLRETNNNRQAMADIGDRMESLMHRGGHGGIIHDLIRKNETLTAELDRINGDTKQILAKESELHSLRTARAEAQGQLEKYYDWDSNYKNWMVIQTFDRLHELEETTRQKTEAYESFLEENRCNDYVPTEEYLSDLIYSRRKVTEGYAALKEAEKALEAAKSSVGITGETENAISVVDELGGEDCIRREAKSLRGGIVKRIALGILSALGIIAGAVMEIVAGGDAEIALRVVGAILCVLGVGGGVWSLVGILGKNKRMSDLLSRFGVRTAAELNGKLCDLAESRIRRDSVRNAILDAEAELERAREDYDNARISLTKLIVRWCEEPPTSGLNMFLDGFENKVSSFLEHRRVLLEEKNTLELTVREIRQSLADTNEVDVRAQVKPLRRKSLETLNHNTIITGIADEKAKISELDRAAYTVENELISLKSAGGDPAATYSKISDIEKRIDELKAKHKAYFIARMAIESASDQLREGISPRLGEYATSLMGIMTDKKYTDFRVEDGLKVRFDDGTGTLRDVDFLSGGTRDLAYVAVRCALVDMLYRECPPLCFDETFAHQDNLRAHAMMKALVHLSGEGYQSFVFTCRQREADMAKELLPTSGVYSLSAR